MKHYVPVRLTTSRYNLCWFNKDLKNIYKKAKISKNPEDWQEFCNIRKDMHKHLRSARLSCAKNLSCNCEC